MSITKIEESASISSRRVKISYKRIPKTLKEFDKEWGITHYVIWSNSRIMGQWLKSVAKDIEILDINLDIGE